MDQKKELKKLFKLPHPSVESSDLVLDDFSLPFFSKLII